MASFRLKMELTGLQSALRSIEGLKQGVRNRVLRPALTAASKPILQRAKAMLPPQYKMLKKSLAVRIQAYRKSGVCVAIIGPRTGFTGKGANRKITAFGKKALALGDKPSMYAHLVEFGHAEVVVKKKKVLSDGSTVYGTHTRATPAQPFLRPAMQQAGGIATRILADRIKDELYKQIAKGAIK